MTLKVGQKFNYRDQMIQEITAINGPYIDSEVIKVLGRGWYVGEGLKESVTAIQNQLTVGTLEHLKLTNYKQINKFIEDTHEKYKN